LVHAGDGSSVKVLVLSDLHTEFAPFRPRATDADVVVLAGDIGTKLSGIEMALAEFSDRPVIYVAGNHEYYGAALPRLTEKMRARAAGSNVHFLENEAVVIDGVRFLGCTLWTDFALFGVDERFTCLGEAETQMTDYLRIRRSPTFRRLRPHDTCILHGGSRRWLEGELVAAFDGPTIVVTHHAPSLASIPEAFRDDMLSAAYASDLSEWMLGKPIDLWIHGHTHNRLDYVVSGIRVVSNQRGYIDELVVGFDPGFVVEVGA
jgi:predicted phosphodiesterase